MVLLCERKDWPPLSLSEATLGTTLTLGGKLTFATVFAEGQHPRSHCIKPSMYFARTFDVHPEITCLRPSCCKPGVRRAVTKSHQCGLCKGHQPVKANATSLVSVCVDGVLVHSVCCRPSQHFSFGWGMLSPAPVGADLESLSDRSTVQDLQGFPPLTIATPSESARRGGYGCWASTERQQIE